MTFLAIVAALAVGFFVGLLVGRKNPGIANAASVLANKAAAEADKGRIAALDKVAPLT